MALFDRFKKSKNDGKSIAVDNQTIEQEENLDWMFDTRPPKYVESDTKQISGAVNEYNEQLGEIQSLVRKIDSTPGNQMLRETIAETANSFLLEKNKEAFKKLYGKIEELRSAIMVVEEFHMGMPKYARNEYLVYSNVLSNMKDDLFLPYLIEKRDCGLIDDDERKKLELIEKSVLPEELNRRYHLGLSWLSAMGMIDITDQQYFRNSFDKHTRGIKADTNESYIITRQQLADYAEYLKNTVVDPTIEKYNNPSEDLSTSGPGMRR